MRSQLRGPKALLITGVTMANGVAGEYTFADAGGNACTVRNLILSNRHGNIITLLLNRDTDAGTAVIFDFTMADGTLYQEIPPDLAVQSISLFPVGTTLFTRGTHWQISGWAENLIG